MEASELRRLLTEHGPAATREWTWGDGSISILATESRKNAGALVAWSMRVWPDIIDRRGKTLLCRLFYRLDGGDGAFEALSRAVEAAEAHGVTLQFLCCHEVAEETRRDSPLSGGASVSVAEFRETYPVIYLAAHGRQWAARK